MPLLSGHMPNSDQMSSRCQPIWPSRPHKSPSVKLKCLSSRREGHSSSSGSKRVCIRALGTWTQSQSWRVCVHHHFLWCSASFLWQSADADRLLYERAFVLNEASSRLQQLKQSWQTNHCRSCWTNLDVYHPGRQACLPQHVDYFNIISLAPGSLRALIAASK